MYASPSDIFNVAVTTAFSDMIALFQFLMLMDSLFLRLVLLLILGQLLRICPYLIAQLQSPLTTLMKMKKMLDSFLFWCMTKGGRRSSSYFCFFSDFILLDTCLCVDFIFVCVVYVLFMTSCLMDTYLCGIYANCFSYENLIYYSCV